MNQAASVDRVQFHPGLLGREDTDINLAMKGFCSPVGGSACFFTTSSVCLCIQCIATHCKGVPALVNLLWNSCK